MKNVDPDLLAVRKMCHSEHIRADYYHEGKRCLGLAALYYSPVAFVPKAFRTYDHQAIPEPIRLNEVWDLLDPSEISKHL